MSRWFKRFEPTSVACDGGGCVHGNPCCALRPQTFFISFHHSHPRSSMSPSSSNPNVSCSLFQNLFDVALKEYRQKTGNDIAADPLTIRLAQCDSPDTVLEVLQEQAHAFNQVRNGDWKIQILRRLKPIVNILLGLSTSGVFGQGIGLVRLNKSTYSLCKFIVHPAETSASASDICWCWSPTRSMCPFSCLAASGVLTPKS